MLKSAILTSLLAATFITQSRTPVSPNAPIRCSSCVEWNAPRPPARVFGNTYFVGTAGLSAILITSDAGLVLVDAALPQSVAMIQQNIRSLGFRPEDIRLIVNSHEHYDHAGGIAALQRATGATVAASAPAARALRQGYPTSEDPQYESGQKVPFAPVPDVKIISDGEVLRVGMLALTAHLTPGHTPGATTWSWRSCEGARCVDIVYADSLTPVSDDGFRFTGDGRRPSLVERFRRSIDTVAHLPCDIVLSPHPGFVDLDGKRARWKANPAVNPFVVPGSCGEYAAAARKRLEMRLKSEAEASR